MGRKAKVLRGQTRTTLFRTQHVEDLDRAAECLGCDFSDVVRASLDLLSPLDPDDIRIRTHAALEQNLRRLRRFDFDPMPAIISGWNGEELRLSLEMAKRPSFVGLIEETARMLRQLLPIPIGSAHRHSFLPPTDLNEAPDDLLQVLSSPGVRVVKHDAAKKRPLVFLAAMAMIPHTSASPGLTRQNDGITAATGDPPELQYQEPLTSMALLIEQQQIKDVSAELLGPVSKVLRCSAFQVDWKRCRRAL